MLFRIFKWTGLALLLSFSTLFFALYIHTHKGSRPWAWTDFPPISNWNSLKIALGRNPCLGTCPVYRVSIDGKGNVLFVGYPRASRALDPVHHSVRISEASVHALFAAFQKAQFFWLYDMYGMAAFDAPSYWISIEYDGHKKKVIRFPGDDTGTSKQITELEDTIDRVAGTSSFLALKDPPPPLDPPPAPSFIEPEKPQPSEPKITIEETEKTR